MTPHRISVSTPGRICLFGEHQDYLLLPVIPCAVSLRISLTGEVTEQPRLDLDLPDIGDHLSLPLNEDMKYVTERDYCRSTINVMRRKGFSFSRGFRGVVHGEIPINSGTSSSSALIANWVALLARISDQSLRLDPDTIARLAHAAEVLEFKEPGGMMDHFSTAMGGVLYLQFHPKVRVEPLNPQLGVFILGDSAEPKNTKGILARVKDGVMRITRQLASRHSDFFLQTVATEHLSQFKSELSADEFSLLQGTVKNRDLTIEARALLHQREMDHEGFGRLLSEHHLILRDVQQISTPKIDRMIDAALSAGALGGKINGSGGGGCMFVYAPDHPETVVEAIEQAGGQAFIVTPAPGTMMQEE